MNKMNKGTELLSNTRHNSGKKEHYIRMSVVNFDCNPEYFTPVIEANDASVNKIF